MRTLDNVAACLRLYLVSFVLEKQVGIVFVLTVVVRSQIIVLPKQPDDMQSTYESVLIVYYFSILCLNVGIVGIDGNQRNNTFKFEQQTKYNGYIYIITGLGKKHNYICMYI